MNLLQMSLYGAVFILIAAIIRSASLNRLPKGTFPALWYIALARLLLPVTFRLPFSVPSAPGRAIPVLDTLKSNISDFTAVISPKQPSGLESGTVQTFQDTPLSLSIFSIVWALGLTVMAGYFIMSYLRCRREFQTSLPVQNSLISLWNSQSPLRRTIEIRQLAGLSTPLTYGIFRPVILVPKDTDWENIRPLQYMLYHEYIHIRRFDAIGKLGAAAALCIHWFNPLVWVLYTLFSQDLELSCDECVMKHFGQKTQKEYAALLVRMEERRSSLTPFGSHFSKNATEERINAIMKFRKKSIYALLVTGILVAAGVLLFLRTPAAGNADYAAVLRDEAPFTYVSEKGMETKTISEVPSLFDPYDTYMKIWDFTLLDLDGDNTAEVVLSVYGAAGDMGGHLILHQDKDRIYGYTVGYRDLMNLKADGTYNYSDPLESGKEGICSIRAFTETGMSLNQIASAGGQWDTYILSGTSATGTEFWIKEDEQAMKPDVAWYAFTDENIRLALP